VPFPYLAAMPGAYAQVDSSCGSLGLWITEADADDLLRSGLLAGEN
jgi:hypothetical protein